MTATGLKYRVEKAARAIDEVGSDTSVGWEETLEALEELYNNIEGRIEAIQEEHKDET